MNLALKRNLEVTMLSVSRADVFAFNRAVRDQTLCVFNEIDPEATRNLSFVYDFSQQDSSRWYKRLVGNTPKTVGDILSQGKMSDFVRKVQLAFFGDNFASVQDGAHDLQNFLNSGPFGVTPVGDEIGQSGNSNYFWVVEPDLKETVYTYLGAVQLYGDRPWLVGQAVMSCRAFLRRGMYASLMAEGNVEFANYLSPEDRLAYVPSTFTPRDFIPSGIKTPGKPRF